MIDTYRTGSGVALVPEASPIESRRFGVSIARLNVPLSSQISDDEIVRVCAETDHDVVILRYPTSRISLANQFAQRAELVSFHADTLVYFSLNVASKPRSFTLPTKYRSRLAVSGDRSILVRIAESAFSGYNSHYAANSRLNQVDIRDGYVEWVASCLGAKSYETLVTLTESDSVSGFAVIKFDHGVAEIVLNAVDQDSQGTGVYGDLLEYVIHLISGRDCKELVVSTTVSNFRAIRAWIRAGFTLEFSLNTIHIMKS